MAQRYIIFGKNPSLPCKKEKKWQIYGLKLSNIRIGAYWIDLYRGSNTSSGTKVASFLYTDSGYSYLMTTNTVYHSGIIHYEGATTGSFYYAVAMYYAGYGGAGDTYRHVSFPSQA